MSSAMHMVPTVENDGEALLQKSESKRNSSKRFGIVFAVALSLVAVSASIWMSRLGVGLTKQISAEDVLQEAAKNKVKRWALSIHNMYRKRHCNTPALKWDNELARDAEQYAQKCPKGHAADRNGAGENLDWSGSSNRIQENKAAWKKAIKGWYDESKNWNYASSKSSRGVTGHFTAMVWKDTTKVGCAMNVKCSNQFPGMTNNIVVCRYKKHPNMIGQYAANVKKLKKSGSC